jgi:hypothetical protein
MTKLNQIRNGISAATDSVDQLFSEYSSERSGDPSEEPLALLFQEALSAMEKLDDALHDAVMAASKADV